ncbi:hypothetical protein ABZ208_13875 [Streptomyces sp. NPDC006208]|uniref:hypothetical protein n=1 Tax=Streptomyces sp. NPDC006208 TaxID=3156734 RepID=UPI0033B244B1
MTGDSITPEQPPSGPLYARESDEPPAVGASRRPEGDSGPQAGADGFEGLARINCAERCEIPEGVQLAEVPRPRHDWGDVVHCPNDGCGRSFLVTPATP